MTAATAVPAPTKLAARGVRIGYRTREGRQVRTVTVVDGIDLDVRDGEFLAVVFLALVGVVLGLLLTALEARVSGWKVDR